MKSENSKTTTKTATVRNVLMNGARSSIRAIEKRKNVTTVCAESGSTAMSGSQPTMKDQSERKREIIAFTIILFFYHLIRSPMHAIASEPMSHHHERGIQSHGMQRACPAPSIILGIDRYMFHHTPHRLSSAGGSKCDPLKRCQIYARKKNQMKISAYGSRVFMRRW